MFPIKLAVFLLLGLGASITLNVLQALFGPFPPRPTDDRVLRLREELNAEALRREIREASEPVSPEDIRRAELRKRLG
jgi:hypothetical protein